MAFRTFSLPMFAPLLCGTPAVIVRLGGVGVNGALAPPQLHHVQAASAKHQHTEGDGCTDGERVAGGWLVALVNRKEGRLTSPPSGSNSHH